MDKLDSLSVPMIMGDWRITIQALEQQLSIKTAVDLDSIDEDDAAEICEDIDKIEGVLGYLKSEFNKKYIQVNQKG